MDRPAPPQAYPVWIRPGRAYRGWGWVVAAACLWLLFALLLAVIGELQRGFEHGRVTRVSLGYYATAAAMLGVALCACVRRPWAQQLATVASAPLLLFFPVGTVVAVMAMRALLRSGPFFERPRP